MPSCFARASCVDFRRFNLARTRSLSVPVSMLRIFANRELGVNTFLNFSLSLNVSISYGRLVSDSLSVKMREVFVRRLEALMTERHLSSVGLAKAIGRSEPWVSQLLAGKRGTTMATIDRMSERLEVPLSYWTSESDLGGHAGSEDSAAPTGGAHAQARVVELEGYIDNLHKVVNEIATLADAILKGVGRAHGSDAATGDSPKTRRAHRKKTGGGRHG